MLCFAFNFKERPVSVYLSIALQLTHCVDECVACVSLRVCVGLGVQAESVQDARQEADVVTNLQTVPKMHQSRQVPQTRP